MDKDGSSEAERDALGVGGGVIVRVKERDIVTSSLADGVFVKESDFTDSEIVAVRLKVGFVILSEPDTVFVCVIVSENDGDLESE